MRSRTTVSLFQFMDEAGETELLQCWLSLDIYRQMHSTNTTAASSNGLRGLANNRSSRVCLNRAQQSQENTRHNADSSQLNGDSSQLNGGSTHHNGVSSQLNGDFSQLERDFSQINGDHDNVSEQQNCRTTDAGTIYRK